MFPCDRVLKHGVTEVTVLRTRKYSAEASPPFIVMVQSRSNIALPFVELGKALYTQYKNVDIYFLTRKKIKIITSDYSVANSIASDDLLNIKFATFIPSELCEVKGVCPIPLAYPESEIFRVCSRGQNLCKTCGAAHDEVECSLSPKCVNCKGKHCSS